MSFRLYLLFIALNFTRPIEMFAPELAYLRIMVVLSVLTIVSSVIAYAQSGKIAAQSVHLKLVFGMLLAWTLSRVAQGWLEPALNTFSDYSLSIFIVLTTFVNVNTVERLKATCKTFAYCMVFLSALGVYSFHTGYMAEKLVLRQFVSDEGSGEAVANVIPADEVSPMFLWRLHSLGMLKDPNDFGQALVVALPMVFGMRVQRRWARNAMLVYLPMMVIVYAVSLTHSRGTLLGVASLLFFGVRSYLGTMRTALLLGGGGLAAMALNVTGGRGYSANEESAGGRVDAWSEGIRMLAHHPLFGVGAGNFTEHHNYTAHNSFVLAFAEVGFVGYFVWLGFLVIAYKGLARVIQHAAPGSLEAQWAVLLRSSLLGFLTCAFFLSKAYDPLLYLLLGCCAALYSVSAKSVEGGVGGIAGFGRVPWRGTTLWIEFGSIFLIYLIVIVKTATVGKSI